MSIHDLIDNLAKAEEDFRQTTFMAPCLKGGKVVVRIHGLIRSFRPAPGDFEGWGIFKAKKVQARFIEEASYRMIQTYVGNLQQLKCRLIHKLKDRTWLAYPHNESDMEQRFWSPAGPFKVHLVEEGARLAGIQAAFDGAHFWYAGPDETTDPSLSSKMRQAFDAGQEPRIPGLTPEMKTCYILAAVEAKEFAKMRDEDRLKDALSLAGGTLNDWADRGNDWMVTWQTKDGEVHRSVVSKDLTVTSAGICLSGQDRKFDLHSLVKVVEDRNKGWDYGWDD